MTVKPLSRGNSNRTRSSREYQKMKNSKTYWFTILIGISICVGITASSCFYEEGDKYWDYSQTTELIDMDGDGYHSTIDCNDADSTIHPGAVETCDGIDNDCLPASTECSQTLNILPEQSGHYFSQNIPLYSRQTRIKTDGRREHGISHSTMKPAWQTGFFTINTGEFQGNWEYVYGANLNLFPKLFAYPYPQPENIVIKHWEIDNYDDFVACAYGCDLDPNSSTGCYHEPPECTIPDLTYGNSLEMLASENGWYNFPLEETKQSFMNLLIDNQGGEITFWVYLHPWFYIADETTPTQEPRVEIYYLE